MLEKLIYVQPVFLCHWSVLNSVVTKNGYLKIVQRGRQRVESLREEASPPPKYATGPEYANSTKRGVFPVLYLEVPLKNSKSPKKLILCRKIQTLSDKSFAQFDISRTYSPPVAFTIS